MSDGSSGTGGAKQDGGDAFNPLTVTLVSSAIVGLSLVALLLIGEGFQPLPVILGILLSILLAALPILLSHGQGTSRERQLLRLDSLAHHPISQTAYYKAARAALLALRPVALDRMYSLPLATLASVLVFGFLAIFLATDAPQAFATPSFILGGAEGLKMDASALATYQKGTFLVLAMSFLGSYSYMLFSLVFRVQNNDVHPIAFYYFSVRMIISCIVAIVLRHVINLFGVDASQAIVLVGFIVGFAPDLFIVAMSRRAFQMIKIIGAQPDPSADDLPTNENLLMIEGMSRDKVDRLNELGIDSAQHLACQNPFLLWTRLPFDLGLIVDWIAQAQLYRWAKEARMKSMRAVGINTIFDFYGFLVTADIPPQVLEAMKIEVGAAASYRASLEQDPAFARLHAVRATLKLAGLGSPTDAVPDDRQRLNGEGSLASTPPIAAAVAIDVGPAVKSAAANLN